VCAHEKKENRYHRNKTERRMAAAADQSDLQEMMAITQPAARERFVAKIGTSSDTYFLIHPTSALRVKASGVTVCGLANES
jgi:hypothetical protein